MGTVSGSDGFAVGVDLGGTKTEAVLLSPDGEALWRKRQATPLEHGYQAVLSGVAELVANAVAAGGGAAYSVGIGIPGSLDVASGLVRNANSTCLIGKPLKADLERLLGRPVQVRNDADCFTMAECHAGAAQGYGLVFGVIMGTGCGGGIAINGAVREGPHRIAGEWGHFSVLPDGPSCYCGNQGCVETLISGSGVERGFFASYGQRLTMQEIVAQARQGEPRCQAAFQRFLDDFGRCLGGLISILDPDAVVLGGGLSNIDELYAEGLEKVRHYVFHDNLRTPLLKNRLGDSAGVIGAAWIGRQPG